MIKLRGEGRESKNETIHNVTVEDLIKDAEDLLIKAINEVPINLRDAAEKAWGATVKVAEAIVLAKTGEVPHPEVRTRKLKELRYVQEMKEFLNGYFSRMGFLHGECFYGGKCEPREAVIEDIVGTRYDIIERGKRIVGMK